MKGSIEVQTEALSSLSRQYKSYGQNIYSRYRTAAGRIERELESICRKYAEYDTVTSKGHHLQSKLREIERDLREVQEKSSKISKGLGAAVQVYKESEQAEKKIIQQQKVTVEKVSQVKTGNTAAINTNIALGTEKGINTNIISSILKNLWENILGFIEKYRNNLEDLTSNTGEITQLSMADFKKLEYEQAEIDSRYEAYYNKIKALGDINKAIGDEEVTIWELERSQLELIQELLGIPIGDDMMVDTAGMTVNMLDALKVKADINLEGNGSYLINSRCIEVLIEKVSKDLEKKQQEDIKKEEDYQKLQAEIRELQLQMQKDYSGYLEKARKGEYYKEYLEDCKAGGWGIIYGQDVLNAYGIDKCGEYAVYSRYITHAPEQIKKTAFYKALENLDVSDMTIEEYINTMGPIWELQQRYRTLNDELRDAQIAMAVLSAFTLPMSLAGGAAIATGVDVASDGIDIAVDIAKGDKVSLGIDLAAVFVPEAIEGLKRVDINTDRAIKNIAEEGIEGVAKAEGIKSWNEITGI